MSALIEAAATRHALPAALIAAIIQVESGGNTWAWNPEPPYRYFWDVKRTRPFRALVSAENATEKPPADFPCLAGDRDNEWWAQQASWGLMQVMGAVARERGYRGPYLTTLLDPEIGVEYGCAHLAHLRGRFMGGYGWDGVIAAYNAGSPRFEGARSERFINQGYVDKVHRALNGAQL